MKVCIKCHAEKEAECFAKKSSSPDGRRNTCRDCTSAAGREYRLRKGPRVKTQRDKEREKKYREKSIARSRAWREANKERAAELSKKYREENREAVRLRQQVWCHNNKERVADSARRFDEKNPGKRNAYRAAHKAKLLSTIEGRINSRVSARIRASLRLGAKGGQRTVDLVGWSMDDLRVHLERQFVRGMGWHNMSQWHIDHIVPVRSFRFDSTDSEEFRAAWALSNLRPIWAADNHSKGGKHVFLL